MNPASVMKSPWVMTSLDLLILGYQVLLYAGLRLRLAGV
jgi:hypothetical protein